MKIELDHHRHLIFSKIIQIFTTNREEFLVVMTVAYYISFVSYGISFFMYFHDPIAKNISTNNLIIICIEITVSLILLIITSEFLPKTLFRRYSNSILHYTSPFAFTVYAILYAPVVFPHKVIKRFIKFVFKKTHDPTNNDRFLEERDIEFFYGSHIENENEPIVTPEEVKILKNAMDFPDIKIRECIVPRNEIIVESIDSDMEDLKKKFIESGFSKIFIYKENIDNIVGYVHTSSIFKHIKTIEEGLNLIPIVPETMQANKLLNKLLKERKSAAVVVDEFGGTSGIVTIEDIIEEIFGEIEDEHDESLYIEKRINKNEYLFSARIEIDYLNEKYGLKFPISDEYETLAGYLLYVYEHMPEKNEVLETDHFIFEIIKVTGPKIETVRIKVK
jgi:CBS domain containing-hemolysin-like protein